MKTKLLPFFGMLLILAGCIVPLSDTEQTYVQYKKQDKDTTVSFLMPVVAPSATTKQEQTKGDVTITAEIVPFDVVRSETENRTLTYSQNSNYDAYEVRNVPAYSITPKDVELKIRVRNNSVKVLRLNAIGVGLIVGGKSVSFPDEDMSTWNKGMILSGFDQEYVFHGPAIDDLNNTPIYLTLQDVPVSYNQASAVTKTEKFEWFFECSTQATSRPDKIIYRYDDVPVYKEQCKACNGLGYTEKTEACHTCNGLGYYTSTDGKTYQCYACKGNKTMIYKYNCVTCNGKGQIAYPKSKRPPVASSVTWSGWQVKVITVPVGAQISTVDVKTLQYTFEGTSNRTVNWVSPSSMQYPILVEYNGKKVKVLPYTEAGKATPTIRIDFTDSVPDVELGKEVK